MRKHYLWILLPLFIAGCQSSSPVGELLAGRKIDYPKEEDQKQRALQYPPDLIANNRFAEGAVSLSEYAIDSVPTIGDSDVVEEGKSVKVSYRRNGRLRWVEIEATADELWPRIRGFWSEHNGFPLVEEKPQVGIMETDWLQLREGLGSPGVLSAYLDKVLSRINDSGERDKFITRLERNESEGTDVYVTHRHIVARFDKDGLFSGYESLAGDEQLEVEMLRRLMLYLSDQELEAENSPIDQEVAEVELASDLSDYEYAGTELWVNKSLQESWQLVQVGLERGGFSIEDRDYQEGIIYIKHSGGPDSDKIFGKAETNFFNRLFGEERPILRDIELVLSEEDSRTKVITRAVKEDAPLTTKQSEVILELLNEYLP